VQVVSVAKTDAFSTASTSFTPVTGLSASITPTSTSSKIYVAVTMTGLANYAAFANYLRIMRDTTAIAVGDTAGSRTRSTFQMGQQTADHTSSAAMNYLDSPSTTSSVTYSVEIRVSGSTGYVNRGIVDTDNAAWARTVSSINLMEIAQ
jgi:hypothetical protein